VKVDFLRSRWTWVSMGSSVAGTSASPPSSLSRVLPSSAARGSSPPGGWAPSLNHYNKLLSIATLRLQIAAIAATCPLITFRHFHSLCFAF
jgi:hypothetical protein